jgi:hypothetical protein
MPSSLHFKLQSILQVVGVHTNTLHYITLHYITLHYITLHYISLHYITLHYIPIHYITPPVRPRLLQQAANDKSCLGAMSGVGKGRDHTCEFLQMAQLMG